MIQRLDQTVRAVCPIHGLAISEGAVRIDYKPEASSAERSAADAALAAFDWSQAADDAWLADQFPERKTLRQQASQAISDNDAYLAVGSPTNAQVIGQVRKLTQENNRIIQRLIQLD